MSQMNLQAVRAALQQLGLSRNELANMLGTSPHNLTGAKRPVSEKLSQEIRWLVDMKVVTGTTPDRADVHLMRRG